jgi:hypothetical protein
VNEVAHAWKAGKDIRAEISKQPQYDQNYDDPGKHEISPFECFARMMNMDDSFRDLCLQQDVERTER